MLPLRCFCFGDTVSARLPPGFVVGSRISVLMQESAAEQDRVGSIDRPTQTRKDMTCPMVSKSVPHRLKSSSAQTLMARLKPCPSSRVSPHLNNVP